MKLLISVKNSAEASEVVRGGLDIIDIKNPEEGSLGANYPDVISNITSSYSDLFVISAAGGDMPNLPGMASLVARGLVFCGLDFIKIGLYGTKTKQQAIYLLKRVKKAVSDVDKNCRVIGVGYADYNQFQGLPVALLPEVAWKSGIDGVMIDTRIKDGTGLFELMNSSELDSFIRDSRDRDLLTALAGSLKKSDFDLLYQLEPDIVGVRSAACNNHNRESQINPGLVQGLNNKLSELVV